MDFHVLKRDKELIKNREAYIAMPDAKSKKLLIDNKTAVGGFFNDLTKMMNEKECLDIFKINFSDH